MTANTGFKKGLIIIGEECIGKSMLANFITNGHKTSEVFTLNGRNKNFLDNPFAFDGLTEKTKIILVDDLHPDIKIEQLFELIAGDLKVHRQSRDSIIIPLAQTQLIVTSDHLKMEDLLSHSTIRRFDIVEIKNCGYVAFNKKQASNEV